MATYSTHVMAVNNNNEALNKIELKSHMLKAQMAFKIAKYKILLSNLTKESNQKE